MGAAPSTNRVLLVGVTGILREIVLDALSGQRDIVLVAEVGAAGAVTGVKTHRPTTVVWADVENVAAEALGDLLYGHPRLRVLTLEGGGRHSHIHELVPTATPLGQLSRRGLLAAVRGSGEA